MHAVLLTVFGSRVTHAACTSPAGILGCTTEFRKWEGITYDAKNKKLYTAISSVEYGMEDNQKNGNPETKYDRGTANHLKMKQNDCGCVMEMDVEHDSAGTLSATKARMLTCGIHDTDPSIPDFCSRDHIANPDNVAMIPDYHQLIIGEDTGKHSNNLIWIWDLPTGAMTRVASTPMGAETTSPYWYSIGDWSYMAYIVQHPRSSVTGYEGYIGYVGPFPRSSLVVKTLEEGTCDACAALEAFYDDVARLQEKIPVSSLHPTDMVQLGPRPDFLVRDMVDSPLKRELEMCLNDNSMHYAPHDFSIGHRGACMMFPEHTEVSTRGQRHAQDVVGRGRACICARTIGSQRSALQEASGPRSVVATQAHIRAGLRLTLKV